MAKRIFTREIREYIFSEIDRRGFVEVDEVAEIIKGLHVYDPLTAEDQGYRDKARRLMASSKDSNGVRVLCAMPEPFGCDIRCGPADREAGRPQRGYRQRAAEKGRAGRTDIPLPQRC